MIMAIERIVDTIVLDEDVDAAGANLAEQIAPAVRCG